MISFVRQNRLNWLLLLIPVSLVLDALHASKVWLFIVSALTIVPLASLIGETTEEISSRLGPGTGGFLNATFGNAPELIISIFALKAGLGPVVKASISGSIIGNTLLVLGCSMFFGGLGRQKQKFSRTAAATYAAMLFLAVVALVMPAVFDVTVYGSLQLRIPAIQNLSLLVSLVLICVYVASMVFSFKTHRDLLKLTTMEPMESQLRVPDAIILLVIATVLTAVEAEFLVGAITEARIALGISEFFVGVVVISILGNAAEYYSAVLSAVKDRMDLAVTISGSSSTQIALFVAPVLVFISWMMGGHLSFIFNAFEIFGVALSVIAMSLVSLDGESNWFEGVQLIAVYLVLAIVFYFVPASMAR